MAKRIILTMFVSAAALFSAEPPSGVPKGATETAPGVYRHVDKDGKAWVYRKTPFGVAKRSEEDEKPLDNRREAPAVSERGRMTPFGETKPGAEAAGPGASSSPMAGTKVFEDGDSLRFERPSPFGVYKWSRKKDELTADEKRLWDAQRDKGAAENGKK